MVKASMLLLLLTFGILTPGPIPAQQPTDLAGVLIAMKRDGYPCGCVPLDKNDRACCPAYSISINGDGTVTYEGISSVPMIGKHTLSIPVAEVRGLVEDAFRIDFFSLKDEYRFKELANGHTVTVDHSNGTTIKITANGKSKNIYIFYGAPAELIQLGRKIDEVTLHLKK